MSPLSRSAALTLMGALNDLPLLEQHVSRNSQETFAPLVPRHINLAQVRVFLPG